MMKTYIHHSSELDERKISSETFHNNEAIQSREKRGNGKNSSNFSVINSQLSSR